MLQSPAELSEAEPLCSLAFHTVQRVHVNTHEQLGSHSMHTYVNIEMNIDIVLDMEIMVLYSNLCLHSLHPAACAG